jgi:hypothetical protein
MTVFWFAIATLTTWRASRAITQEDGPWDVFSRIQERVGGSKNWIGRGLGCPLCVGIYVALAFVLIGLPLLPIDGWRSFLLIWGGISGGAAVIQKVVG